MLEVESIHSAQVIPSSASKEGMTWAEWIDSTSNTIGLYLSDGADGVYWSWCCLFDATDAVKASDVIEAEAYTLIQTEC